MSRVGVGVVGFGTVGTGVVKILLRNAALIRRRVGVPIELVRVADLDVTRDRGIALPPGVLVNEAKQVLSDPAVLPWVVPTCLPCRRSSVGRAADS